MAENAYDEFDLAASRPEASVRSFGTPVRSEVTPESWDDLERYPEYDFGPLRVRVPADAELRMADPDLLYSDAAYFVFPDGKVRLSVLAAPRGGRLWPQRAEEIATMQANLGADVRSYTGEWGEELQITDDGETNWVIGVDGPRWMLLGRSTSPIGSDHDLSHTMRDMIRSSVVFRGNEPLPVRTPLPLREPGTFDADDEGEDRASEGPYAGVVTLILPKVEAPVADDPIDRQVNPDAAGSGAAGHGGAGHGAAGLGAAGLAAAGLAAAGHEATDHDSEYRDPANYGSANPAVVDPPVANRDWAVAARAASASENAASRAERRTAPVVEPVPPAQVQRDDDELSRRRAAAEPEHAAPRKRGGGLLSAAALVVLVAVVGLTGLVFALRGSTPGTPESSVAAPQQVDEKLPPIQTYPDDAYATAPKAPKVASQLPAPKAAPPLAAGSAIKGAAPVAGVPGAKPVTPRVATPVRSSPVAAGGAARSLPNAAGARTPATAPARSASAPSAVQPSRSGPGHQSSSDDYSDSRSRDSRSKPRHDEGDDGDSGPLGALSDGVLGVVPGLG